MATPTLDITPAGGLDVGDTRTFKALVTDLDDVPATVDPADVTVTVRRPSGAETAYTAGELTSGGTGVISVKLKLNTYGRWHWRVDWDDGTDSESTEVSFLVRKPKVTPA